MVNPEGTTFPPVLVALSAPAFYGCPNSWPYGHLESAVLEKVWAFCQKECFSNTTHRELRVIENLCVQKISEENVQKRIPDYFKYM